MGEVNTLPSMTVPDQDLTVKDILYRFTKGLPLDGLTRLDSYDDDDDWEVSPFNQLGHDLTDITSAADNIALCLQSDDEATQVENVTTTNSNDDDANTTE